MTLFKVQSMMDILDKCKEYQIHEGVALFYTLPGLVWAKVNADGFRWRKETDEPPFGDILKARLFNNTCEIHLWKDDSQEGLIGRFQSFDKLESTKIEKKWLLLGQAVKQEDGFSLMEEDKGGIGWIPLELNQGEYASIRVIHDMGFVGEHEQNATIKDVLFAGLDVYKEDEK
jgi:CRISPR-associated protein (TIGR03984 family)